jgi:hypothetical protein
MENIIQFFVNYGWQLGLIALAGVIILGVLKYCNVFEKIGSDTTRHLIYCGCSVGLTLIGIAIYLLCTTWDWTSFLALVPVVWALNQAMYNLFKVTKLNDLCVMVLNLIKNFIIKQETTESK